MFGCCALLGAVCVAWRSLFDVARWPNDVKAVGMLTLIALIAAIYWHTWPRHDKRDAALALPWTAAVLVLFAWTVQVCARFGLPLRDRLYVAIDHWLGISTATIVAWSGRHPGLDALLRGSYDRLFFLLFFGAIFAPPIIGIRAAAERFLLGNAVSILLSLPISVLLPAVGPWVGYGFAPSTGQHTVELSIAALRGGHRMIVSGIVCFPSFHVIWVVLSAAALWWMKPLRVPIAVITALIVISTVTTGWHYVCDVLAGLAIAAISLIIAERFRCRYLSPAEVRPQ